ncbi:MAG: hypothetical protein R3Y54_12430 [Eubacteriales bacterium]
MGKLNTIDYVSVGIFSVLFIVCVFVVASIQFVTILALCMPPFMTLATGVDPTQTLAVIEVATPTMLAIFVVLTFILRIGIR